MGVSVSVVIETANGRILVVALLLASHSVLFSMYAQQPVNPEAGVYPGGSTVVENPDRYLGKHVVMEGIVQEPSPTVIAVHTSDGTTMITVTGTGFTPETGDKLRVFGTLSDPGTVESESGFAVPERGFWYTWSISFLAGLWVLVRLLRHWKLDVSHMRFSRRDRPLTLREIKSTVRDTDA